MYPSSHVAVSLTFSKVILISLHNGLQTSSIKASNRKKWAYQDRYEKVETFKYLLFLLTNENSTKEEFKCRLKAENSCYSVQTHLSSRVLSKN